MTTVHPMTSGSRSTRIRSWAGPVLAAASLIVGLGVSSPAQSGSWRDDRPRSFRHDGSHHRFKHHHAPRATIVVRPGWPHHARPSYAPPRIVYHRHPYRVPSYHPGFPCRPWEGPVWNGRYYEHAYGTICLLPDGTWQLID